MTDQTLIEKVARAMARANYPGGSESDIDQMWDGWMLEAEAAIKAMPSWQPIETAPKDGTTIDVWRDGSRETVYWGLPPHECGEMGQYCDSDWHSIKKPGWICSTFGEFVGGKHDPFTHWMPLPAPPIDAALKGEEG